MHFGLMEVAAVVWGGVFIVGLTVPACEVLVYIYL